MRVEDLLVESAASIVNLTVRRIAKPDEQDLEQARVGIEAVRALVDLVEGEVAGQIRSALSDLQLLYARASRGEPLEGPPGSPRRAPPRATSASPSGRRSHRRSSGLREETDPGIQGGMGKLAAAFRPSACGRLCHESPQNLVP